MKLSIHTYLCQHAVKTENGNYVSGRKWDLKETKWATPAAPLQKCVWVSSQKLIDRVKALVVWWSNSQQGATAATCYTTGAGCEVTMCWSDFTL